MLLLPDTLVMKADIKEGLKVRKWSFEILKFKVFMFGCNR